MVDLIIDTRRIEGLLQAGPEAVFGQSFSTVNKVAYDKVGALLKQRNALVHRGEEPDAAALKDELDAIYALLDWIDQQ